jgi:metal-responsive CopG/Arc/MetJ family transcriptional regulator
MPPRSDTAISFYVTYELRAKIDAAVQALGISRSELLRMAVTQFLVNEKLYDNDNRKGKG